MTKEGMIDCIDAILIESVNYKLESQKLPKWTDKTIDDLNIHRIISRSIDGGIEQFEKMLNLIDPNKIPVDILAKIQTSSENKTVLLKVWKQLLGNIFAKGHLDKIVEEKNIKESISQLKYGELYVKARKFIPNDLAKDLKEFIDELDKKRT